MTPFAAGLLFGLLVGVLLVSVLCVGWRELRCEFPGRFSPFESRTVVRVSGPGGRPVPRRRGGDPAGCRDGSADSFGGRR